MLDDTKLLDKPPSKEEEKTLGTMFGTAEEMYSGDIILTDAEFKRQVKKALKDGIKRGILPKPHEFGFNDKAEALCKEICIRRQLGIKAITSYPEKYKGDMKYPIPFYSTLATED